MPGKGFWLQLFFSLLNLHLSSLASVSSSSATNVNKPIGDISKFRQMALANLPANSTFNVDLLQDNLYVTRWLELGKFNVNQALKHFQSHVTWRNANKLDTVNFDIPSGLLPEYPMFSDTVDRTGRPITEAWLSDWNIRRAVLTGQFSKLVQMMTFTLERTQRRLYNFRRNGTSNVTGAVELINADGFNAIQHGCIRCLPLYLVMAKICNENYPGLLEDIYMVNVGPYYRSFLRSVPNTFDTKDKQVIHLFGEHQEWDRVISKQIAKTQRSTCFGGTIERQFIS